MTLKKWRSHFCYCNDDFHFWNYIVLNAAQAILSYELSPVHTDVQIYGYIELCLRKKTTQNFVPSTRAVSIFGLYAAVSIVNCFSVYNPMPLNPHNTCPYFGLRSFSAPLLGMTAAIRIQGVTSQPVTSRSMTLDQWTFPWKWWDK